MRTVLRKGVVAMFLCVALLLGAFIDASAQTRRRHHHSRKKGAIVGGLVGAVGGGLIGGRKGVLIGAGAGAGSGYLVQRYRNRKHRRRHY
jgi:osmotically inducible lipoprotein OsmB